MKFSQSSLRKLRKIVGSRFILIPGARIVVHDRLGRVLLELRDRPHRGRGVRHHAHAGGGGVGIAPVAR